MSNSNNDDSDDGLGEYFRAYRKERQEKRANNREQSAQYLRDRGIVFIEKNNGAHLIVQGRNCYIDFWPGTGKWNCRTGKKGFGVRNLVAYVNGGRT